MGWEAKFLFRSCGREGEGRRGRRGWDEVKEHILNEVCHGLIEQDMKKVCAVYFMCVTIVTQGESHQSG